MIVDREYGMWAVVEVELEKHSLEHHVLPQIRAFTTGHYDKSHAELLHKKDSTLTLGGLVNLITYNPPVVLVIVNSRSVLNDGWGILESEYSSHLMFIESFRSEDGDVIVSISGYIPTPKSHRIIKLKKHPMMNALISLEPMKIPADIISKIRVHWRERPYTWQILRTKDAVVFLVSGGVTIRPDRNYEIRRAYEGSYELHQL